MTSRPAQSRFPSPHTPSLPHMSRTRFPPGFRSKCQQQGAFATAHHVVLHNTSGRADAAHPAAPSPNLHPSPSSSPFPRAPQSHGVNRIHHTQKARVDRHRARSRRRAGEAVAGPPVCFVPLVLVLPLYGRVMGVRADETRPRQHFDGLKPSMDAGTLLFGGQCWDLSWRLPSLV